MKIFILAVLLAFSGNCFAIGSELGSECTEAGSPCMMEKVEEEYKELDDRLSKLSKKYTKDNVILPDILNDDYELSNSISIEVDDLEEIDINNSIFKSSDKYLKKYYFLSENLIEKYVTRKTYKLNNSLNTAKSIFHLDNMELFSINYARMDGGMLKAENCNLYKDYEGWSRKYDCDNDVIFKISSGKNGFYYGSLTTVDKIGILMKAYYIISTKNNELLIVNDLDKNGEKIEDNVNLLNDVL